MLMNSIQAAAAAAFCGLSTPTLPQNTPVEFVPIAATTITVAAPAPAPAPAAVLASTQDRTPDCFSELPEVPACPSGQSHNQDCLEVAKYNAMWRRVTQMNTHSAALTSILNSSMTTQEKVDAIVAQGKAHNKQMDTIDTEFLQHAADCCEPSGGNGGEDPPGPGGCGIPWMCGPVWIGPGPWLCLLGLLDEYNLEVQQLFDDLGPYVLGGEIPIEDFYAELANITEAYEEQAAADCCP